MIARRADSLGDLNRSLPKLDLPNLDVDHHPRRFGLQRMLPLGLDQVDVLLDRGLQRRTGTDQGYATDPRELRLLKSLIVEVLVLRDEYPTALQCRDCDDLVWRIVGNVSAQTVHAVTAAGEVVATELGTFWCANEALAYARQATDQQRSRTAKPPVQTKLRTRR